MIIQDVVKAIKDKNFISSESTFRDQTSVETTKANLRDLLCYLKQTPEPGFDTLMDLTGVDYLTPDKHTKVIYFLHNTNNNERIRISLDVKRNETIPSIIDLWESADWYERELFDLFGVHFEGHPNLQRILMPDDWKGHPLQKDYALTEEPVQFKHGVEPKIPSKIIPKTSGPLQFNQQGTYVKSDETA